MPNIIWLDRPAATSAELVGPKAASLARFCQAGLPVPPGFCLTAEAAAWHLQASGLEAAARRLDEPSSSGSDLDREAVAMRSALSAAPLSPALEAELGQSFVRLRAAGHRLVAVRSSALVENRPGASFAGLFSTFLGVNGSDELAAAIRACWAARWSDRVLGYARSRGAHLGRAGMAVIVQAMVPANAAGIALSADPSSGDREVILVNSAWGLGRAVNEGEIVPDLWRLDRRGLDIRERRLGHKPLAASLGPDGGEVWSRQPPERAAAPSLDDATLLDLGRMVLRVEALFGGPQEVEWAQAVGQLWLLQARPLPLRSVSSAPARAGFAASPLVEGQPTSAGQAIGRARVVRRPEDLADVQPGEILVTTFMRPSMTAALPRIAGLVVEAGGSTSHAATLARERQIPAVMGALGATRLIPNGATVLVDGTTGRVSTTVPAARRRLRQSCCP